MYGPWHPAEIPVYDADAQVLTNSNILLVYLNVIATFSILYVSVLVNAPHFKRNRVTINCLPKLER